MTDGKHTLGPWWTGAEYDEEQFGCAIIAANTSSGPLPGNPTRGMVAWASELTIERAEECEANARLIAAAPDLLDALQHLSSVYENIWVKMSDGEMAIVKGAWDLAEIAIAKAEGRP